MRLLFFILFFPGFVFGQYDSTKKRAEMTGYGYQFKNIKVPGNGSFVGPTDTLRLAFADSGAIAAKNGTLYAFNGRFWTAAGGFDTTGIRYRPTAGDGISITGAYPAQTIAGNPDTLIAGSGITLTPSGTKKVTIGANTANLDSLYGGKLDSVRLRGSTLREFAAGDSTLIGTVSGGGGGTLQQAWDSSNAAAPVPTIEFNDNGYAAAIFGQGYGWFFEKYDILTNWQTSFAVSNEGTIAFNSNTGGSTGHSFNMNPLKATIAADDSAITRVGIGTTFPTAPLHVFGAPRFETDSAAAGYVWTAKDTTGQGEWRPAAGGSTDTTNLSDRINLKADTVNQTFTGRNTFTSTTSGVIIPRVTTAEMNAISGATPGEIVYNTDEGATFYYTTDWGWMSDAPEWKRRNGVEQFSEFIIQPTATNMQTDFFTTILANSGTIGSAAAVSNRPGIYQLSTAGTSNARSSLVADATYATNILLGGGQLMYETEVQIPTLSNSSETFRFFVGLTNNTQTVSVSSVAFLYDSSGSTDGSAVSGNWQVVCANASSRSYTTTSVPVVAGQWYKLKAVVNADRTQVQFYIDGNIVRTETNNIPATGVTPAVVLTKTAGTTARTALIDWFFLKQKFTTQR